MLKQHQIDKVFGALVTAVHMTRAAAAQSPMLGYALLAGTTLTLAPVVQPVVQTIAQSEVADQAQKSVRMTMQMMESGLRSMAPEGDAEWRASGLSREQFRVASYAAGKYKVPLAEVQKYVAMAFDTARAQRVDPMLVVAVMAVESGFRPAVQSQMGAQGLMQIHAVAHRPRFEAFGGKDMVLDPAANIEVGVQILKEYLRRTTSSEMALKYYVGAANQDNDGGYGYKVLSERERMLAAAAGRPIPAVPLKAPEWLLAKWAGARSADAVPAAGQHKSQGNPAGEGTSESAPAERLPALDAAPAAREQAIMPLAPATPAPEEKSRDAANEQATIRLSLADRASDGANQGR